MVFFLAPLPRRGRISPRPPSPTGKGEFFGFLMQGASPLASPRLNPRGTGSTCHSGTRRLCLWLRQLGAKPIEPPFYWQCRQPRREGDRGRWNYPSQATAAFEMVLSPGAGRISAAGGLPFFSPAYPASAGAEPGRHLPCPPHPAAFSETGTSRGSVNKNSRKVLGGLGDSFKSPPAFLPFPSFPSFPPFPVTASMGCQAGGRRGLRRSRRRWRRRGR